MKNPKKIFSIVLLTIAMVLVVLTLVKASGLDGPEPFEMDVVKPNVDNNDKNKAENEAKDKGQNNDKKQKNKPLTNRQEIAKELKARNMFAPPPPLPQPPGSVG